MSARFESLQRIFSQSRDVGLKGLRDDSDVTQGKTLRPAAVLIAVTDRKEPGILLTQRPETMPAHPGQVAFPGGKLEAGEDAIEAALREAHEELAIQPSLVRVIGATQHFVTGSGFSLTPVLGMVPHDIPIQPDPREVASWFEIPLRYALDQTNHVHKTGLFRGTERSYIEIMWEGNRIWGITAGILANLSHRLAWQELIDD